MMSTHNKTLQLIASKLGLGDEDRVIRKAAEFERLLQTKTMAGSNMSDTSKVVICLDLASFVLGVALDTKSAIKYSGLRPPTYTSMRKVVESLLELDGEKLTVAAACVRLQCSPAQELAESILQEYRKQAKMDIDLNLPQYVCMAVHQACRLNKVKVSKAKLIEASRLRPAQWSKLETDWAKFVEKNFATAKKKRDRSVKTADVNEENDIDKPSKEELNTEHKTESYEDWKRRMLETAYKELGELEQQAKKQRIENSGEERRSPRKHSQNLSPKKNNQLLSPGKCQDLNKFTQLLSPNKHQQVPTQVSQHLSTRKQSQCSSPKTDQPPSLPVSLRFSARKHSQCLSPRKENLLSPRKEHLSLQVSPRLSTRKQSQCWSPRKENLLSPRKEPSLSPMQEDMSPRRSPRKTPQKFSPYKTPTANNGVRLLFPKNI